MTESERFEEDVLAQARVFAESEQCIAKINADSAERIERVRASTRQSRHQVMMVVAGVLGTLALVGLFCFGCQQQADSCADRGGWFSANSSECEFPDSESE